MGTTTTLGLAETATTEDHLRRALTYQVTGNFYPPLPAAYADLGARAVLACAAERPDEWIDIPADIDPKPARARALESGQWEVQAAELVDCLRAWPFVDAVLNDWEADQ